MDAWTSISHPRWGVNGCLYRLLPLMRGRVAAGRALGIPAVSATTKHEKARSRDLVLKGPKKKDFS